MTHPTAPPTNNASAPIGPADAPRPWRVLVVDDEALVGRTIERVLRPHQVTAVTSGREALDLLADGQDFDAVVSDLAMPEMSGMEFYLSLVERHPHLAPRVVFVTGSASAADARAFLAGVANECLDKPFDLQDLRDAIRRVVR